VARESLASLTRRSALAGGTALVTGASGAFGSATLQVLRYLGANALTVIAAGLRERHSGHPRDDRTPEKRTAKEHRP
jgi:NAD(P)-dependent dehydrogenase (short-subunit alcohol dehydrogenase family)